MTDLEIAREKVDNASKWYYEVVEDKTSTKEEITEARKLLRQAEKELTPLVDKYHGS